MTLIWHKHSMLPSLIHTDWEHLLLPLLHSAKDSLTVP
jgi:hypothetical protein